MQWIFRRRSIREQMSTNIPREAAVDAPPQSQHAAG